MRHNEASQTRRLKQQKFTFSWFWRLEAQAQDVAGLVSSMSSLLDV